MDRVQVQPHHIEAAFADLRSELKRRLEEKGGLSFASTHTKEVIKECLDLAVGTLFSVATAKAWTEEFKGAGEK